MIKTTPFERAFGDCGKEKHHFNWKKLPAEPGIGRGSLWGLVGVEGREKGQKTCCGREPLYELFIQFVDCGLAWLHDVSELMLCSINVAMNYGWILLIFYLYVVTKKIYRFGISYRLLHPCWLPRRAPLVPPGQSSSPTVHPTAPSPLLQPLWELHLWWLQALQLQLRWRLWWWLQPGRIQTHTSPWRRPPQQVCAAGGRDGTASTHIFIWVHFVVLRGVLNTGQWLQVLIVFD